MASGAQSVSRHLEFTSPPTSAFALSSSQFSASANAQQQQMTTTTPVAVNNAQFQQFQRSVHSVSSSHSSGHQLSSSSQQPPLTLQPKSRNNAALHTSAHQTPHGAAQFTPQQLLQTPSAALNAAPMASLSTPFSSQHFQQSQPQQSHSQQNHQSHSHSHAQQQPPRSVRRVLATLTPAQRRALSNRAALVTPLTPAHAQVSAILKSFPDVASPPSSSSAAAVASSAATASTAPSAGVIAGGPAFGSLLGPSVMRPLAAPIDVSVHANNVRAVHRQPPPPPRAHVSQQLGEMTPMTAATARLLDAAVDGYGDDDDGADDAEMLEFLRAQLATLGE